MNRTELILRILIAVVVGEILLALGTTLAQEVFVDGVSWETSGRSDLLIGGLGSLLAAMVSGAVAFLIVRRASRIPVLVISVLVILETSWLVLSGRSGGPLWFSVLGGALLIAGLWLGQAILAKSGGSSKAA